MAIDNVTDQALEEIRQIFSGYLSPDDLPSDEKKLERLVKYSTGVLRDKNSERVEKAIVVLKHISPKLAAGPLVKALEDPNVSYLVRDIFLEYGVSSATVRPLVRLAANGTSEYAREFAKGIVILDYADTGSGYELCRELVYELGHKDGNVRSVAGEMIKSFGCQKMTVECLLEAFESRVRVKRMMAEELLIGFGRSALIFFSETPVDSPKYRSMMRVRTAVYERERKDFRMVSS